MTTLETSVRESADRTGTRQAVAVVGGTGFLGRHVVAALEEAGLEARPLSRRTGFDALRPDPEALRGCAAVVNLAGIKRPQGEQSFHAVHVELVERLIEAMRAAGVRRLVHVSVVVAREDAERPYHDTKWRGEQLVRQSGLDWTILRPGVIYGAGDDMLSHLALMLRAAPLFPIVGDGGAPMMPVDARDVARAVVLALEAPTRTGRRSTVGATYDVVGPRRMDLREVVSTCAEACGLATRIVPTPPWLMRGPVWCMERFAAKPLSTRAQLRMLEEGLAGDPEPARRELGLATQPFTAERVRPLMERLAAPRMSVRLGSAPRGPKELPARPALAVVALGAVLLALVFLRGADRWIEMTLALAPVSALALCFRSVRRSLRPDARSLAIGVLSGLAFYGLARLFVLAFPALRPGIAELQGWRGEHGAALLLATLALVIVPGEELLWRGLLNRLAVERVGRGLGILASSAVYAAVHLTAGNPLLPAAALGLGVAWAWLHVVTDGLAAPLASHLAFDLLVLFVAPLAP